MISSLFCCLGLLHCGVKKDPIAQNYQAGPLSALEELEKPPAPEDAEDSKASKESQE